MSRQQYVAATRPVYMAANHWRRIRVNGRKKVFGSYLISRVCRRYDARVEEHANELDEGIHPEKSDNLLPAHGGVL